MTKLAVFATAFLATFGLLLAPVAVHAQTANPNLCDGILLTEGPDGGDCSQITSDDADSSVATIINTVIDIFSIIVGAVSVIMIIFGGLRYITSAGDSANVTAARNTILYAVVGLVIVIFAQTIVKFVVARLTSADE
jgi:hypothetical protein